MVVRNSNRMVRDTKYYLKVFIVGMLILLNVAVFVNGVQLSCDKCMVTFNNNVVSGVEIRGDNFDIEILMDELYEGWEKGMCIVQFDRVRGYYK